MSSKANKKDFLNKKRKQVSEDEENSANNSSANLDLDEGEKSTTKNAGSKNSSKGEKYNEDILVGKDEVTLIVNRHFIYFDAESKLFSFSER